MNANAEIESGIEQINRRIWELWRDYPREAGPIAARFAARPKTQDTLLFLGLNPAFPEEHKIDGTCREWIVLKSRMVQLGLLSQNDDYRKAVCWKSIETVLKKPGATKEKIVTLIADIHHDARWFYGKRWFKRLNDLAMNLGVQVEDYGHVDLYLWSDSIRS